MDVKRGSDGVQQADALYKQASSQLGLTRGFLGLSRAKADQGTQLLTKAANLYKLNQQYQKAGDALSECGKVQLRIDCGADACGSFSSAATCYSLANQPQLTLKCQQKAASIWMDRGRLSMAAKQLLACGDTCHSKMGDMSGAMDNYGKALELYETENQPAAAGKAREKLALLQMESGDFMSAKENFERLGMIAKDHRLLHFGASDHMFKATLCALALDHVHASLCLKQFSEEHPEFRKSRQFSFLYQLVEAVKEDSTEKLDEALKTYTLYNTAYPWLAKVVDRIRQTLPSVCGWSELEGSLPVNERKEVKPNHFLSNMLNRGTALKALYLQRTPTSNPHSNSKHNQPNSSLSTASQNNQHSANGTQNIKDPSNPFSYDDYDDSMNPFSDNYRYASEEELDLR